MIIVCFRKTFWNLRVMIVEAGGSIFTLRCIWRHVIGAFTLNISRWNFNLLTTIGALHLQSYGRYIDFKWSFTVWTVKPGMIHLSRSEDGACSVPIERRP